MPGTDQAGTRVREALTRGFVGGVERQRAREVAAGVGGTALLEIAEVLTAEGFPAEQIEVFDQLRLLGADVADVPEVWIR
jgi:hypothetical protein